MNKLQSFAATSGLELIAISSVWNIHKSDHLCNIAKKRGSNLNSEFKKMVSNGLKGGFTLVVGKIGRSQHSKTEVGIFKGVVEGYQDEVFINEPNLKFFS